MQPTVFSPDSGQQHVLQLNYFKKQRNIKVPRCVTPRLNKFQITALKPFLFYVQI